MTKEQYLALILYNELRLYVNRTDREFYLNLANKMIDAIEFYKKGRRTIVTFRDEGI